jgi:hypothetical protein
MNEESNLSLVVALQVFCFKAGSCAVWRSAKPTQRSLEQAKTCKLVYIHLTHEYVLKLSTVEVTGHIIR